MRPQEPVLRGSLCGSVHRSIEEDPVRIARHELVFFQGKTDTAAELPDGAILFGGQSLEEHGEDELGAFNGINSEYLRIGNESGLNSSTITSVVGNAE